MPQVKVATLNIFNRMGDWDARFPVVIDQLEELAPDVIGFQEIDFMLDQGMLVSRAINKRLPERPHYRIKHASSPGQRASVFGIATLAKLDCVAHEILDLMTYERIAQRMVYDVSGARFAVVNTHLHHPPEDSDARVQQAEYLLDWLGRHDSLPTVILGDFNSYAGEPTVTLFKSRFRSAHETVHGKEPEYTWPTPVNTFDNSPAGTLDYIYVSPELKIADAGLAFDKPADGNPDLFPSDHLGLFATLEW